MEHIDARRALELLIDVVDQYGEDTVYEKVMPPGADSAEGVLYAPGCRYEHNGVASCLVAHALLRAGVSVTQLQSLDSNGSAANELHGIFLEISEDAAEVFQAAQSTQDNERSWGEALRRARDKYEILTRGDAQ